MLSPSARDMLLRAFLQVNPMRQVLFLFYRGGGHREVKYLASNPIATGLGFKLRPDLKLVSWPLWSRATLSDMGATSHYLSLN